MKDRIKQLMDDQHLTQQSFAQLIGSTPATLSNIFNGKTNPSLSIVDGIHKSFPQVNVYWILYGTPPMYNSQEAQGDGNESLSNGLDPMNESLAAKAGSMTGSSARPVGSSVEATLDFGAASSTGSPTSPSLFEQPQMQGVNRTPKNIAQTAVKYVDKQQRKITEIRIFYDDQTWETFVPKK